MRILIILLILSGSVFAEGLTLQKQKAFAKEIDKLIKTKLVEKKISPMGPISEEVFVRRIYLDIVGRIPTHKEANKYLDSKNSVKRSLLVDELLASTGYASHNFNYWADVLRSTSKLRNLSGENYINFIKESIRKDKPYDKFVNELLGSEGLGYKMGNGATGYYFRDANMPLDNMANSMQIFLGTSLVCAQCHDHPFDDWSQMDFFKLAAFTSGTKASKGAAKSDPRVGTLQKYRKEIKSDKDKSKILKEIAEVMFSGVNNMGSGMIRLPHDYDYDDAKPNEIIKAEVPFGPQVSLTFPKPKVEKPNKKRKKARKPKKKKKLATPGEDINSRQVFANWATSRENPMFTKVIVNRMWDKIIGTPLVGPLMNISVKSKGVNPELTTKLIEVMKAVNYSLKDFVRVVYKTKIYQSKALNADLIGGDKNYFSGPMLKRLSAEQLWDSLLSLAVEFPDSKVPLAPQYGKETLMYEEMHKLSADEVIEIVKNTKDRNYFKKFSKDAKDKNMSMSMGMSSMQSQEKAMNKSYDKQKKMYASLSKDLKAAKKKKDRSKFNEIRAKLKTFKADFGNMQSKRKLIKNESKKDFQRASEIRSPADVNHFLRRFGQSDRLIIDGASTEASVPQALTLLNGKVEDYLTLNPVSSINRNMNAAKTVPQKIKVAYMSILSRKPREAESSMFSQQFKVDTEQAQKDLVWVLINSNEFMFRK